LLDRERQDYRATIADLLALDRRDPARRRRVDERFGPRAHFARRFPSLHDARQFLEGRFESTLIIEEVKT